MAILKKILINFLRLERKHLKKIYFFEKIHQMEKNSPKKEVVQLFFKKSVCFFFFFFAL
jgi:hypothetical protein